MGHESIVYGCILGRGWKRPKMRYLQRLNREYLYSLPVQDSWPPLTRDMFSIQGEESDEYPVAGRYKHQAIHFGGTYKEIEFTWENWLEKFEKILANLYWEQAFLHLRTELVGNYDYLYKASYLNEPQNELPPLSEVCELRGGPRKFVWQEDPTMYGDEKSVWIYDNGTWQAK